MKNRLKMIRITLALFMAALVLSGLTAMAIPQGLSRLAAGFAGHEGTISDFIRLANEGVRASFSRYPFIAYGTDWLAFAHVVIALAFVFVYRHPQRNRDIVKFGLAACAMVIPFALIAGAYRDIPLVWRLLDCSFGIVGAIPLLLVNRWINNMNIDETNRSHGK